MNANYSYSLPKVNYVANSTSQAFWWYNFIGKYLTNYNLGTYGETSYAGNTMQSVVWGCTEWTGYTQNGLTGTSGGVSPSQPGYGINPYPTMDVNNPTTTSYPSNNLPAGQGTDLSVGQGWTGGSQVLTAPGGTVAATWWPASRYTHPSERALMADSIFWVQISNYISPTDQPVLPITTNSASDIISGEAFTYCDFYRHGEPPKILVSGAGGRGGGSASWAPTGGRVAYNILFVDGHVITSTQKTDAYKCFRMRYPG